MNLLYSDHQKWINIVKNFGCNNATAQDIVGEMYIKIQALIERGTNIMFDENTVNYYYIFRTLNSLFIDLKRKEKNINNVDIESINLEGINIEPDFTGKYDIIKKGLDSLYWYDKKVYEIIESGESIASLSKKTKISYYSLYNTYTKVKKYLKSLL
tara:strand:- start:326 stop:793 length:468 start_codon:yes stop_codon:yes gene_type:complete